MFKGWKKNAKWNLTRIFNQQVVLISNEKSESCKIVEVVERLERLRHEVMMSLEESEMAQDEENERKASKKTEKVRVQVD